jgi:glycosyltransferase involved in cell wall biosynthesis
VDASALADRARAAVGVVACNPDVAQHVDVPGARLRLLPHGVDLARFAPRSRPVAGETREGDPLRVLAVGRLVEKKGFPTLIEAAARMRGAVTVRIVGTGAERATIERLVEQRGVTEQVHFRGRRSHEDLPEEYAWADVVAVPSVVDRNGDRDGLPNVALEAMACGRPLVVSDVSALGPAVRAAGSGLVVAPGDRDELAAALETLRDPGRRAVLARAGRRHVEEHYDLEACTRRLVEHLGALHAREPERVDA